MPAVAGDTVFIGSCAGVFYALNKTTGVIQWTYDITKDGKQRSFHGNPLIKDGLILIGTDYGCEGLGHLYAFETKTGKVRWKYRSKSVSTDVVSIGPNVYVGSHQDRWSALNSKTGDLVWDFSTGAANTNCDVPKSPVVDDKHLYFTGFDGFVYSLDAVTGRVVWKRKLSALPSTALLYNDKTLVVGTADNRIHELDAATGRTLDELSLEATPQGRLTIVDDSLIFFMENPASKLGFIVSTDLKLRTIRWTQKVSPDWTSERPYVWNGLVIAGNCRGQLASFRLSDGVPQWKLNLTGCIRSVGSDADVLFVGVQEGTVYALRQQ